MSGSKFRMILKDLMIKTFWGIKPYILNMKSSKLNSAMVNWENRTILVNLSRSDESTTFGPYSCTGK